ncbi:type IV secretion system protein, partial [Cetobacterium sp.]|uniref:type IV secretion system protein n=1 Tax=Cetobacterium sp. TaxID=2071632 RepID=UPI003EE4D95B
SRDVFINSFTKISGTKNSYQVRWEEKIYDKNGKVVSKENLIGIFTLDKKQPKTLEEIDNNPLGIMVTDFSISKEK